MKQFIKMAWMMSIIFLILSCSSLKRLSYYDNNDSYVNVKKERQKQLELLALQKKQQQEKQKQMQDSIAKEQEKINNNPYYKEPNYNKDDYYDYEYAARLKRFYNPVNGLGYYDNWYTNYGFYGTPNYGSSIYMGYGSAYPYYGYGSSFYGSPFYSIGLGNYWGNPFYSPFYGSYWGYSPYYGYSPYMSYGLGYSPFYSPFYGYGYSPYGYGPYYGYAYPAYYNSSDINSMTYAPRTSHEGFNSPRTPNNINNYDGNGRMVKSPTVMETTPYLSDIPKFDETARPKQVTKFEPSQINAVNAPLIHQITTKPDIQTNLIPRNTSFSSPVLNANPTVISSPRGVEVNQGRPFNPTKAIPVESTPKENFNNNFNNSNFNQRGWGGGSGGFESAPRGGFGGGGGGSVRPR